MENSAERFEVACAAMEAMRGRDDLVPDLPERLNVARRLYEGPGFTEEQRFFDDIT